MPEPGGLTDRRTQLVSRNQALSTRLLRCAATGQVSQDSQSSWADAGVTSESTAVGRPPVDPPALPAADGRERAQKGPAHRCRASRNQLHTGCSISPIQRFDEPPARLLDGSHRTVVAVADGADAVDNHDKIGTTVTVEIRQNAAVVDVLLGDAR